MIDDDDIPVLTQILRTGDRSTSAASANPPPAPTGHETPQVIDAGPSEPAVMLDALVIGSEPPVAVVDAPAALPGNDDGLHERRDAAGDGPSDAHAGDSFRLPQDHDHSAPTGAPITRFDVPEIVGRADAAVAASRPTASVERRVEQWGEQRVARHERRVNPFPSDEPRERRQGSDAISLQRLASITSSVRDSVLVALQTRIDTELDARIAQAMHREVETAIAHLQDKLRDGLTDALRDVVARAVDDEMSRFVAAEREAAARLDPRKPPVRPDA